MKTLSIAISELINKYAIAYVLICYSIFVYLNISYFKFDRDIAYGTSMIFIGLLWLGLRWFFNKLREKYSKELNLK